MYRWDLALPAPAATRCRVRLGEGVLAQLGRDLARTPPRGRLVVLVDARIVASHGRAVCSELRRAGMRPDLVAVRAGESRKTRATKAWIEDRLFELAAGRDTVLVAVGGGVLGDLAGFVAATWQRGVPVWHVPTTVVAMADSALGGKTAVNLPGGKNLVGAFHQPAGVYADPSTLSTLPDRHYRDGFAEIIKTAAVADATLFRRLEGQVDLLRARDRAVLTPILARCLRLKAEVVRRDERDVGLRALLNFGHTLGHAIEIVTRYRLSHGRAVALGLALEARIAHHVAGLPQHDVERLDALLQAFGFAPRIPAGLDPADLVAASLRDKKVRRGVVRYALPQRLGRLPRRSDPTHAVPALMVRQVLATFSRRR